MKILHILSQRPDSTGSGIYLQAMLREAYKTGHSNFVIAGINKDSHPDINPLHTIKSQYILFETEELPFTIPGMSDVMPYHSSRFQDLTDQQLETYEQVFLKKVTEMVNDCKPDIIHSHHLWLLSSLIKRNFPEIPLVANCHGSDLRQFHLCPHLQKKVLKGCRKIEAILALSEEQKKEIADLYSTPRDKIHVVGGGFDDTLFRFRQKSSPPPVQILYCGKLSRAKGVPWLLRALKKITEPYVFHLVGGGSGQEWKECIQLAERLGNNIQIHGAVNQKKLAELLRLSHIFVLPSFYEGLPLVILEALACGCKIVTTDLPGCREINSTIREDLISFVPLPRLHSIDQPFNEDVEIFTENLRKTIHTCIQSCRLTHLPDKKSSIDNTRKFTWRRIFAKIEKNYVEVV